MIMGAKGIWDYTNQQKWAEEEMLEKASIIVEQQKATWEFMARNQDLINYDEDGNYDYKHLNCSTVAMGIATMVSTQTEYIIKPTNFQPRNVLNIPDEFEQKGLEYLKSNPNEKYWSLTDDQGKSVFRYMTTLFMAKNCLDCHGKPVGEIDVTGFPKDGLEVGDFAGAISLQIPADIYRDNIRSNMISNMVFIVSLLVIFIVVIRVLMTKMVTNSLKQFEEAAVKVGKGEWDVDFTRIPARGEVKRLVSYFQDMTEQLQGLYSGLESEVEKRTGQLKEANEILELQRAQLLEMNENIQGISDYKSDVLAVMSHELRTPLSSIIAFAQIALVNVDKDDVEQEQNLKDILLNSEKLLSLINTVLDLAKIEAGKEEVNWDIVDMNDVAASTENSMTGLARSKDIKLSVRVSPDVPLTEADPEKLVMVLDNLVSNAIKYTDLGGQVDVTIIYDTANNMIVMQVEDTGIGIPKEKVSQIFDPFTQVDGSISRPHGGTGLGLSLVREIVQMHEGIARVESELGKGSRFIVELPLKEV
jgi:signal transduction histidine kinase